MLRQFSAGAIVFKDGKVLLIKNKSIKDKKISFWGFPKGHIEKEESSKDAALRELEEETGIKAEIIKKVGESRYIFTQGGERIFKIVIVYLMKYLSGEAKPQIAEIDEVVWMDPDQALKTLTFKNDRDLLKKVIEIKNG
ncbi:NUDIX hydrolase [Candidatus Daviesbacteria bacterium]|nr:NUDIX hydrolase [Candidatus Daviesbacteria bacterium]